ncbi:MAG: L-seryl-tRNA(Sec) selenium transferase [Defluviitaleaceae bacterium]|nr:L-seryl-tRNA(Sec) selenium transferase [Defluviitaleaceae bacterium]
MDRNEILRGIPKVDEVVRAARQILDGLRTDVLAGKINEIPHFEEIVESVVGGQNQSPLHRVINATGIVLHTNLGRAPLAPVAVERVRVAAGGYSALEYDLATGRRGSRMKAVEQQLTELCQTQAALCVNNNAAAVLLTLTALCSGGRVVVSRGELVEIGGSFRIPDVISAGGAILAEVGTTNKVRLADYDGACSMATAALLKVHTSNYRIVGYTQEVGLEELASLAAARDIPLIYDLGGGSLVKLSPHEPTVQEAAQHADIVCFSGDKLLGGPQAGIIVGKAEYIDQIRKHPLYRALRMDKLSLAALEATLKLYIDGAAADVPTISMLTISSEELHAKATTFLTKIKPQNGLFSTEIAETSGQAGGGSLPGEEFPSWAVAITTTVMPLHTLEEALRKHEVPIIGRIHKDKLLLDVRTIDITDFPIIARTLDEIFRGGATNE